MGIRERFERNTSGVVVTLVDDDTFEVWILVGKDRLTDLDDSVPVARGNNDGERDGQTLPLEYELAFLATVVILASASLAPLMTGSS